MSITPYHPHRQAIGLATNSGVICSATTEGLLWVNGREVSLPLAIKLSDHFFWRQVEIDLSGCQPIMPQNLLQGSGGNTLLDAGHRERVPQHMRCHRSANKRQIGDLFDQALDRPHSDAEISM
jgi:hypothetical protein